MRKVLKYTRGFILLIVALVSFNFGLILVAPSSFALVVYKLRFKGVFKYLNDVALGLAISIDIMCNVLFGYLLTKVLSKDTFVANRYQFGKVETISKALGINKYNGTLTKTGKYLADFLNWIDMDHVEKAAGTKQ